MSSKKQNLLAIFTFEETGFQSKTNTFSMDAMVFSGYIRLFLYLESSSINLQTSHYL